MLDELREKVEHVTLGVGDLIIDVRTGSKGFLSERERRIDITHDDIYIWKISWFHHSKKFSQFNALPFMEEEGLKMSILIGTIIIHKAGVDSE
mgnify:FL=1